VREKLRSWARRGPRDRAENGPAPDPDRLPDPIEADLDAPALDLWRAKGVQVLTDTYAGIPMMKFPEDLRVYEHILWSRRIDTVIELGTHSGGSALWFRDRMRTFAGYGRLANDPQVIAVEFDATDARRLLAAVDENYGSEITLLEGDVRDPEMAERVRGFLRPGASCLVVEDTAHTYETSIAALRLYSDMVAPGGMFVVEDGCVDVEEMRVDPDWPRGVLPAVREWLATEQGANFRQRRDMELYGITCHPEGFLERVS
jgi:cephalosporin hydroxylase